MNRHDRHFKALEAIAVASEPVSGQRIAALILLKNEVIAVGWNKPKSHPMAKRYGKNPLAIYLHAEIDAIKNALRVVKPEDLSRATMYVLRMKYEEDESGNQMRGLAKPCSGCHHAIKQFGLRKVFYTTNGGMEQLEE